MKKPNIVVFFTDQQRADSCGCYGAKFNATPNLDNFARKNTLFENSFSCQPVCGPARAAIQTGQYPTNIGCYINGIALPENSDTIAKRLGENDYQTAYVGKWHLATTDGIDDFETSAIPKEKRGGYQDYWIASDVLEFTSHGYNGYVFNKDNKKLEFKGYRPDCITDYALDFLDTAKKDKPFFLFLSHIEPHHQNDRNCFEGPEGCKEEFKNAKVPDDLTAFEGNYTKEFADYLGAVKSLDQNFGRVIKKLEEISESENTIVIFTSDHGCHFKTRNREYKRSCHDASIKIPFVIGGGSFRGGKKISEITSLIDLPTTILSLGGCGYSHTQGQPLDKGKHTDVAFVQISEDHVGRAIRTKDFTYEAWAEDLDGYKDSFSPVYTEHFLYDNRTDKTQTQNLISDPKYADIKKQLKKQLEKSIEKYEHKKSICE